MAFTIPSIFTAIDKFSSPVKAMSSSITDFANKSEAEIARVERKFRAIQSTASSVAKNAGVVGLAIVAPLAVASKSAIDFQDQMADVAKTTGLSGSALDNYGQSILDLSTTTRTGIKDLVKIGEIGGQLGVASNELVAFTQASNKFAVALGEDYGGTEQAIQQVGKINKLFKDTRGLDISSSITKAGSVINELGAKGSGTSANINDFVLRVGALPDALKPSLTATAALGTLLEESGVDAQIGASGFANFITTAGENLPKFAKQMGLSEKAAQDLFKSDPSQFASKFAQSLKGIDPAKLPLVLKGYKLQSTEVLKTLGVLMTNQERLAELNGFASDSFAKGTSLQEEYNKKQETTAAKLAIAKNNMQALSITIGTQLLPIINSLVEKILPVVKGFIDWAKENPELIKTILKVAGGIAVAAFAISAISGAVAFGAGIMTTYGYAVKAVAGAQWLLNAAMSPFGLMLIAIVLAIAAIITVVVLITKYWQDWGAAITAVAAIATAFFAPFIAAFALIISLVQSFRRNWDMIGEAFSKGGILKGLLAIGATLFDVVLMPLQQIFKLASSLPGKMGDWASQGASDIEKFRGNIGVNTTTDESGNALDKKEAINTKQAEQEALVQRMEKTSTSNVNVNFNDPGGMVKNIQQDNNLIPINLTSTSTWGQ